MEITLLNFEFTDVQLGEIQAEKATADLLTKFNYETDTSLESSCWNPITLKYYLHLAPIIVVKRQAGYACLGSGRALRLAQEIYQPTDLVPVLCIKSNRVSLEDKFQILAADVFAMHSFCRTRRHVARQLQAIWLELKQAGIETIKGTSASDFSAATGYSSKALTPDP